jgi:hypothetical protein
MSALADFRTAIEAPGAPEAPEEIAVLLADAARQACADNGLLASEIDPWGPMVTMLLAPNHAWEAMVIGANQYQFYPGFVSPSGSIQWANVWIADFLSVAKLLDEIALEIGKAAGVAS